MVKIEIFTKIEYNTYIKYYNISNLDIFGDMDSSNNVSCVFGVSDGGIGIQPKVEGIMNNTVYNKEPNLENQEIKKKSCCENCCDCISCHGCCHGCCKSTPVIIIVNPNHGLGHSQNHHYNYCNCAICSSCSSCLNTCCDSTKQCVSNCNIVAICSQVGVVLSNLVGTCTQVGTDGCSFLCSIVECILNV